LLVWSVVVMGMDNVIRPLLIRRGVDLPLLLIFSGVIGGLLTMGLLGLFVGPVLLAVTFNLFEAWAGLSEQMPPAARGATPSSTTPKKEG
jgi:predicted PurR-regulated permease PerM